MSWGNTGFLGKAKRPDESARKRQEEQIAIQEARAEAAERLELRKGRSARKARKTGGGMRLLLSSARPNAQLGLTTTLG